MAPTPEATAKLFLEQVRRHVRLLRYGSREAVFAAIGVLLLALAGWAQALKKEILLAPLPKWAQSGTAVTLGCAGVLFLALAARQIWRKVAAPPREPDEPRLPALKGAASFGEQDAELFARLGRVDELQHLRQWILDDQKALLVVMGESGVGKTSLLRAGLAHELQRDAVPVVYWEALPVGAEAGLLDAVRAAWNGPEPAPDSIAALARAVAPRRVVLVLDQLEQLSPEAHPGIFSLLREVLLAHPPYRATWIVAFRREYAAAWRDFELSLPDHAERRPEMLSVKRFALPAARRVIAVLAEEAGLAIDQTIVGDLVDDLAMDGRVSPVDIGITLFGLGELAGANGDAPLTRSGFRAGDGPTGLLTRYLESILGGFPETDQREILPALLALVDLEKDQRIAEGRDLAALAERARPASLNRFAAALQYLASGKARVLENLAAPASEPRYRLVHERLVPAVRSLTGVLVAEADRAGLELDRGYRRWRNNHRKGRYLLAGGELRSILSQRDQLPWGEDEQEKRGFLRRSRRRRLLVRSLAVALGGLVVASGLALEAGLQRRELAGRLAGWNLPADLGDHLGQLEELQISSVGELDWLGAAKHLKSLSVTGVRSFAGLPPSLRFLTLKLSEDSVTDLTGLPAGLQTLKVRGGAISTLAGLPRGLRSLDIASYRVTSLAGLPPGLEHLAIKHCRLSSLAGLPPRLRELAIDDDKIASLAALPSGLQSLVVKGPNVTSVAGLPPGLLHLEVSREPLAENPALGSLSGLPSGLRSLSACVEDNAAFAGLPPGLQTLDVAMIRPGSLAGLPAQLRSLTVRRCYLYFLAAKGKPAAPRMTSLAGLPAGLRSLSVNDGAVLDDKIASVAGLPASLRVLTIGGDKILSLAGLPDGLTDLSASGEAITSLAGSPPGLRSLQITANHLLSLAGLPRDLQSLTVWSDGLTSLAGLPPGLPSLEIHGERIASLAGLPPGLRSLKVESDHFTSLAGLPRGLRTLDFQGTGVTSLAALPPGLQSLTAAASITSLAGLPHGLQNLFAFGNLASLAGLPPRLRSLQAEGAKITRLAKLPDSLRELNLWQTNITNLAGLPPGLVALTLRQNGATTTLQGLPASVRVLRFLDDRPGQDDDDGGGA